MIGLQARVEQGDGPLERLQERLPTVLRQGLEAALRDGLAAARQAMAAGLHERSGRLAASLDYRLDQASGWEAQGSLFSDAPYAAALENGAVIQAKQAKYLRFQVAGHWVRVKRVILPARPFLGPGQEAAAQALEERLSQALMEEMP